LPWCERVFLCHTFPPRCFCLTADLRGSGPNSHRLPMQALPPSFISSILSQWWEVTNTKQLPRPGSWTLWPLWPHDKPWRGLFLQGMEPRAGLWPLLLHTLAHSSVLSCFETYRDLRLAHEHCLNMTGWQGKPIMQAASFLQSTYWIGAQ
jgi:hypothetical protein